MICELAFTGETTFTLLQPRIKNGIVWGVLVAQNWGWSGISYDQNCSFVSDGMTSIFFEPFRKAKALRELVVCGVENVIVIKMSFGCLADAAVLKYTIYTPISSVCENKNDGQSGVHKSSPIRSKWMTYWPM